MSSPRRPLYERLPEVYHIQDEKQAPPDQLKAYVGLMDEVFLAIRDQVEQRYHDFFIETCEPWVIPYLADELGVSNLSGDPWTLRADVARSVFHRRRKGTLSVLESLVFSLTHWAAQAVEMRERLAWAQPLNHQRPDIGGASPFAAMRGTHNLVRGGTANLRDPGQLALLNSAFDPLAHIPDLKPPGAGLNLPDVGIFLWRLVDYTVPRLQPVLVDQVSPALAPFPVRYKLHPTGLAMPLFNHFSFNADDEPPDLSKIDAVPNPIPRARLNSADPLIGNATVAQYVRVVLYDGVTPAAATDAFGLLLHLPKPEFAAVTWTFRGANLCAWEKGLRPALAAHEIVIDPERGRIMFGAATAPEETALKTKFFASVTHGASGDRSGRGVGAQPENRPNAATIWNVIPHKVSGFGVDTKKVLRDALDAVQGSNLPVIIEIQDSLTYELDISLMTNIGSDHGTKVFCLKANLWIRAADGQRPVINLVKPLGFRPASVDDEAGRLLMQSLEVRLEGLYITRAAGFSGPALINRAALNRLQIDGCTLDPGGTMLENLSGRNPALTSLALANDFGFARQTSDGEAEWQAFTQEPEIVMTHTISGSLMLDSSYHLNTEAVIVDAASGVADGVAEAVAPYAIAAATNPDTEWGPHLTIKGVTVFGRVRVASADGEGGIFVRRLQVHEHQTGCLHLSYFRGDNDRLPPHVGCVFGRGGLRLQFTSEIFGRPAYAQLQRNCDSHIIEQGPGSDEMGAYGYLNNTHKWKNMAIRLREFTPAGCKAVLIPVT